MSATSTEPARAADETSPRQLGLGVATAIVVANMIGVGVFTSTGFQATDLVDPATILSTWVIGGLLALCGAAVYAELATMMPKAGGEYVYLRTAYHPSVGFASGWVSLTAGFSAPIAAASLAFARYLRQAFPALAFDERWLALLLIAGLAALHARDAVLGGRVQAAFTIGKALLILAFIVAGLLFGEGSWSHFEPQRGGLSNVPTLAFATSLMYVSFAYSGWNAATYVAGEIDNPGKTLPWALLGGTTLVMVLYVLLNVVFLYAAPPAELAGVLEVGDLAGRRLFGDTTGRALSTLIAVALISSVSAMIMTGPRVYAAMAEDQALPGALAKRSARGVPTRAVALQALLASILVWFWNPDELIRYVGFWLAIFAALTVSSLFVMRRRRGTPRGTYRTPGYPLTPVLFIALSVWIAFAQIRAGLTARPRELVLAVVTVVAGTVVFALWKRRTLGRTTRA